MLKKRHHKWRFSQWPYTDDVMEERFKNWSDQDIMLSLGESISYELTEMPNPDLERLVRVTQEHMYELIRRDRLR